MKNEASEQGRRWERSADNGHNRHSMEALSFHLLDLTKWKFNLIYLSARFSWKHSFSPLQSSPRAGCLHACSRFGDLLEEMLLNRLLKSLLRMQLINGERSVCVPHSARVGFAVFLTWNFNKISKFQQQFIELVRRGHLIEFKMKL